MNEILNKVSEAMDIPVSVICSNTRKHKIVLARQIAIYLFVKQENKKPPSLQKQVNEFFKMTHGTMYNSIQKVQDYLDCGDKITVSAIEKIEMCAK